MERTEILVVGGGPGGLACATMLAQNGARVALAERKPEIGPKVCAGGITWHGLIKHVPSSLIERSFPEQLIVTPGQRLTVTEKKSHHRHGQPAAAWRMDGRSGGGGRSHPAQRRAGVRACGQSGNS